MFYRFARALCYIVLFFVRRWVVLGQVNIPESGGLIVVSNHISYWDPIAVGCALKRKVFFMAKAELFSMPVLGPIISKLDTIPVRRVGSDARAVKRALELLRQGQVVGIFPEGTRSHTGELLPPHVGAAMLSLRARVPVLPVAVIGTKGVFCKVKVIIGKPLDFSRVKQHKEHYEAVSMAIMQEISRLKRKG